MNIVLFGPSGPMGTLMTLPLRHGPHKPHKQDAVRDEVGLQFSQGYVEGFLDSEEILGTHRWHAVFL